MAERAVATWRSTRKWAIAAAEGSGAARMTESSEEATVEMMAESPGLVTFLTSTLGLVETVTD